MMRLAGRDLAYVLVMLALSVVDLVVWTTGVSLTASLLAARILGPYARRPGRLGSDTRGTGSPSGSVRPAPRIEWAPAFSADASGDS